MKWIAAVSFAFVMSAGISEAAVISFASRAAFDAAHPGATVVNYDGDASNTTIPSGTAYEGVVHTPSTGDGLITSIFVTSTSPNGLGRTGAGFFNAGDSITFTFAGPTSAFAIDINTFATAAGAYTATTDTNDVAGSVFNPFPAASTGQFIGFASTVPFTSVTVTGDTSATYDTLRHVPAAVPEPSALMLLTASILGAAALRRRR